MKIFFFKGLFPAPHSSHSSSEPTSLSGIWASRDPSQGPGATKPGLGGGSVPPNSPQLGIPSEKGMQFFEKKNEKLFSLLSPAPVSRNCQPWMMGWVFSIIPFPCISCSFLPILIYF